jgi:hypothetical protein
MFRKEFQAVLIETPPSEQNRLFSAGDGYPRLWDVTNEKAARDIAFMLIDNGLKASVTRVQVEVIVPDSR